MRIVIIGLLYICFMLAGCPEWLASGSEPLLVRGLTYSFFHANVFHLAVNCLAVWCMWNPKWDRSNIRELILALLVAFVVYPVGPRPCIGFSNVLFAACGLRIRNFLASWSWRKADILLFYAMMIAMCFFRQFAGLSHLAAYLLGAALAQLIYAISPIIRDARRLTAHR